MPIPKRNKKTEDRKTFMARCMGDPVMNKEYPDQSQRAAICMRQSAADINEAVADELFFQQHGYYELMDTVAEQYGGKKRSELKDSDFLDSQNRAFPVVTCADVMDAVNSWGRYKGPMTLEQFKSRLTSKAKSIGCASSLPKSWRE